VRLLEDLPVIVELVDNHDKFEELLADIENEINDRKTTLGKVQLRFYRSEGDGER
jgi:PII-like signaling protein